MNAPELSVVGVGNVLYRDEGVGVYAARYLGQAFRFTPKVDVVDGALLGFGLADCFEAGRRVIVLDALLADAEPGTVYRLDTEQLLDLGPDMRPTAHEVDPIHLLRRARAFGELTEMVLLGIVPEDARQMAMGLTPALAAAFPRLVQAAVDELGGHGVALEQVSAPPLDQLIESLAHAA
jgi:hydrogenase maturation protease